MLSVRLASESDIKDIFEWRNDKLTRKMSLSSEKIEWEAHCRWFEAAINNPNQLLVICENEQSEKIATLRFDISENRALVSINMAPSQRGKGFAKQSLISGISLLRKNYPEVLFLDAEIKASNMASMALFEGLGFKKSKQKDGLFLLELLLTKT